MGFFGGPERLKCLHGFAGGVDDRFFWEPCFGGEANKSNSSWPHCKKCLPLGSNAHCALTGGAAATMFVVSFLERAYNIIMLK